MTDLTRRRRTAQQILLRRALSKSVGRCQAATELVPNKGGIVVPPSLTREPQLLNQIRERSSSRAVKKVHRFLAANPFRILQERKAAGKLSGCVLQRKDSLSWRKLKPSDADPTISGHNLKINERSRGSTRSRHSSSTYPSTWQLNVSRAKEELQDNSQGSLEEIINCSILNRTPYDHQLSMPLKSDNSCQCTINKKSRRRGRKTKTVSVAQAQTQTIRESGKKRSLSKSSEVSVQFQRLKQRVYSGEEFSQERKICISPSKISGNSKVSFKCAKTCPGKSYKNFGGYSPSETDIETEAEYHPNLQGPSAYLNKIEEISKPPSNVDMKWSHNMPSKTEIQQSMARGSQESERMYKDQDWEIQRKISKCYCTNARTREIQARSGGVKDIKSIRHGELQQNIPRIGSENRRMNKPNFHDNDRKFQRKFSNCFCTNPRRRDNLVENARAQETMSKKSSVNNSFNSLNEYSMQSEPSQASLSTSEQFAYEASEDNFSHDEFRAQNAYLNKGITHGINPRHVYQTNEYTTKSGPSVKSIIYYSDDSDSQETKHEGQTNNNQMVNASSKSKSFLNRELRQAKASKRPPKRGTQSFNTEESSPGFLQMRTRQEINSGGVMRTEAITQTSELLISKRIYASSDNSQGTPSNKANQVEESNQGLKNSVKPNQDNFKQAKSDKTKLMSKQNQDIEVQEQSKLLKLVQSNSLIIDSDIGQYQLVQSNSVELKSLPEFVPKTKKANPTRKRRSSRSCCRCCSRCSTRKRSLKKPVISEKTKKRVCENCECNPTVDKDQKLIGGMPNSGKCNVREILDILQKTLAGLEKQINIKKQCKGSNKKKTVKCTKPKSSKGHAQHNKIPNQYVNQVRTQNIPYKQGNSLSDHDQPLDSFQNHPYLRNKTVPANVGAPTNIYQTNAYGTAGPANVENPTNIYRSNSNTNLPNSPFYKNSVSPKNVGENINQNNTIQRTALPENDSLQNGSNPAPVEVPFKNERITRSSENSYRNQETLNEPIKYINKPYEQSNYSKEEYNSQILSQSFNQTYTTPQCIRNNPQMDGFQESDFARTPMTDSAYNQGSRDTTNSTSQNSKKICKGPECCPYRSLYKVDDGSINRGVVTFQDCEKICKESSSPNDVPNKGTTNQAPLQICTNFAYPENLKQFSSWANQTNSISNKAPSYSTGNDSPRINPECACGYEQKEREQVCNGPEYCPYQSRFRADVAPNSRGGVTFQDCDKSCIEMSGRNYEDPVKVCENYHIPETILYLKSWDNSIYPILNRTQVLRKKNAITECDPECFFNQKQRQVPFQKGGTADNYKDFCENPYCPENNSFKNVSRSERGQTCQELRSSTWENSNRPENELVYRTFTHYHQEEPLYREELHESPERQVICERGSEEDSNYSDAQQCFNSSSYIKRSYSTEECSPKCPTRPKMSNQDDKRKESPRNTKVSISRRSRNSDRVTNNRLHGAPKKENLCKNSQFENGIFSDQKKTYRYSERQPKVGDEDVLDICPQECLNQGSFNYLKSRYKQLALEIVDNCKCPDGLNRVSSKDNLGKNSQWLEKRKKYKTERYEEPDIKVCENPNCINKNRMIRDQNKYPTYADNSYRAEPKRKYDKQLCENPKCPDQKSIYIAPNETGYKNVTSHKVRSERKSSYKESKPIAQGKIPSDISYDPNCLERNVEYKDIQSEEDSDSCPDDCYNCQRYLSITDRSNRVKQEDNDFKACVNQKCPDRLNTVDQNKYYRKNRYEKPVYGSPDCPDETNENGNAAYEHDRVCSEKNSTKMEQKSMDLDEQYLCSVDCPNRQRVLFTDLRRFKIKQRNTSRQNSGRSDEYADGKIVAKACNKCKRYVPLESDRQAIKKYCRQCKTKVKRNTGSVENIMVCISPGKQAPIFVKNRHNPLVTNPILNSYDKHILKNFHKFKEEKNIRGKCSEGCPFIGHIEDEIPLKNHSSGSRDKKAPQEKPSPCYCESEELIEYKDQKINKSKISFITCEKSPKNESKSKTNFESPSREKEPSPMRNNKSSGFSCLKQTEKYSQEKSKPNEKTPSKSSGFACFKQKDQKIPEKNKPIEKSHSKSSGFLSFKQKGKNQQEKPKPNKETPSSKSSGFLCFKKKEKPPQENKPEMNKKSEYGIIEKPSGPGVQYRKKKDKENNAKIKIEERNKKSSKRSGFFSWCKKHQTAKESSRKVEKVPSNITCTCSKYAQPKDQEIPMLKSEMPFRCPCAPEDIEDGEVKVLYDSSFRFQKESSSCAEVAKKVYCHNNPQQPAQDTSDWYESSRATSTISCRQKFGDQETTYCPCASANGFYKIVR